MTINGMRGTPSRPLPQLCLHRTTAVRSLRKALMAVQIRLEAHDLDWRSNTNHRFIIGKIYDALHFGNGKWG